MLILLTYLLSMNKLFFTKWSIDCLTDDIIERLKVSLIERLFDNIIYESNHKNATFDDLPIYDDEILITRRWIYL